MRKGQITVFIILGLVVLIVIVGALYLVKNAKKGSINDIESSGIAEVDKINSYSGQCFNNIIDESIKDVLLQGGYFDINTVANKEIANYAIPYYLKGSNISVPTEEQVHESLKKMIIKNFDECTDGYSAFDKFDVVITKGDTSVTITAKDGTQIELNPELDINYKDTIYSSKSVTKFLDLNLTPMLISAQKIMEIQKDFEKGYISIESFQQMTKENNVYFNLFGVDDNTALLVLNYDKNYEHALYSLIDIGESNE